MLKKIDLIEGRAVSVADGLGDYCLRDTLECGQCFRFERVVEGARLPDEYVVTMKNRIVHVGQRERGELIFFGEDDAASDPEIRSFFALDTDLSEIKRDVIGRTSSEWLKAAAECGGGIAILKQDEWEMLISFIISQNNNIPRIKKIIKQICIEYGVNLTLQNSPNPSCPLSICNGEPNEEICKKCGVCYSFPTAYDILERPEGLLPSRPGFRYSYILDAAEKIASGEIRLDMIAAARSYSHTVEVLKGIKGVGDKVASCVALFGFANLEAFPIDVWMKRAIDTYFDGVLDPASLGRYAGFAQQYIFHYIRNIEKA